MGTIKEVQLDSDIEELEAKIFGATKDEKVDDSATDTDETLSTEETAKNADDQTAESETASTEKQKAQEGEDWEYRYKKLRSASDQFKFNARTTIANLEYKVSSLEKVIRETPVVEPDIFEGAVSEEDTALLGDKAVEVMKRVSKTAADKASEPLKAKLEAERKKAEAAKGEAEKVANEAKRTNFINRLAKAVPEYNEIDHDKGFEKFLLEDDPINGGQRMGYFKAANDRWDVATIVNYMREYRPLKVDKLANKVTPTGTPVSTTDTSELETKLLPVSDMEKFYDDVNRNKYKGKASLLAKHQLHWDTALEEGRIDFNR